MVRKKGQELPLREHLSIIVGTHKADLLLDLMCQWTILQSTCSNLKMSPSQRCCRKLMEKAVSFIQAIIN